MNRCKTKDIQVKTRTGFLLALEMIQEYGRKQIMLIFIAEGGAAHFGHLEKGNERRSKREEKNFNRSELKRCRITTSPRVHGG